MKLSDATFYVGQTNNLSVRLREHKDGHQEQTRGGDPRLVYYEPFEGMSQVVKKLEKELIDLNKTGVGRRRLREMIEELRATLKLIDLEA